MFQSTSLKNTQSQNFTNNRNTQQEEENSYQPQKIFRTGFDGPAPIDFFSPVTQCQVAETEEELQMKEDENEIPQKPNRTGLPDDLKAGVENLSGYSMDDVKVHHNSDMPAQIGALAYAQGADIHIAPGQEEHLPHEAWHIAQQKQGRVKPTKQMKDSVNVNDDKSLEKEADVMGNIALNTSVKEEDYEQKTIQSKTIQKVKINNKGKKSIVGDHNTKNIEAFDAWLRSLSADKLEIVIDSLQKHQKETHERTALQNAMIQYILLKQTDVDEEEDDPDLERELDELGVDSDEEELSETEEELKALGHEVTNITEEDLRADMEQLRSLYKEIRSTSDLVKAASSIKIPDNSSIQDKIDKLQVQIDAFIDEQNRISEIISGVAIPDYSDEELEAELEQLKVDDVIEELNQIKVSSNPILEDQSEKEKEKLVVRKPKRKEVAQLSPAKDVDPIQAKSVSPNNSITTSSSFYDANLDNSSHIVQKKDNVVFDQVSSFVDKNWPKNWGAELNAKAGITFGIPVGVDANLMTHFYRKDKDVIVLRKYTKGKAGLDTGISAGAYFGLKGKYGVGAEAGVDGEVMGALYSDLLYEFPIKDGQAVTSALYSILPENNIKPAVDLAITFLDYLSGSNFDPVKYMKSCEVAGGAEAKGTASAQAGLRTSESGKNYAQKNNPNEFIPDDAAGKPDNILLRMLNITAMASVGANAFGGAKIEMTERDPETYNIKKAKATVFVKAGAEGNIATPIPLLNAAGSGSGAYKINFLYDAGKGWVKDDTTLSVSTGELDFYNGPGMELEVGLKDKNPKDWKEGDLKSYFSTIKFTKRIAVEGLFGRRYKGFKNSFDGLDRMVKNTKSANKAALGLNVGSYLTVSFDFAKIDISPLVEIAKSIKPEGVYNEFKYFMETGEFSKEFTANASKIFDVFRAAIDKVEIFIRIGGGVAAGVKLSGLELKGRLAFNVEGAITYTEDFTQYLKNDFKIDDLKNLVKGIMPLE